MSSRRLVLAACAALCLVSAPPAIGTDDDGQPDSHTFELDVSVLLGKTLVIHSWDTIRFLNTGTADATATFYPHGSESDAPLGQDPANMIPTRERGSYWDGNDIINSGQLAPGANYWITLVEYGTYQFYDIFRPELRGTVVVVPETKHIPNEGTPLDAAAVAADPDLSVLAENNK